MIQSPIAQSFSLIEFPSTDRPRLNASIQGTIHRSGSIVHLTYELLGANHVQIPSPTAPERRMDLWEETCFEWFVGQTGTIDYWEFNLAPSGHWNCFHLDDYRQGLIEEPSIETLPIQVAYRDDAANAPGRDRLTLALSVDLGRFIGSNQGIDVGITAVIQSRSGDLHYLALAHCGEVADFHLRESFQIRL